jgi:aubergine-like protein
MLIGIDVTHKQRRSIVGVCGTINPEMMQYNSQYII